MSQTRREFGRLALGGLAAASCARGLEVQGVRIGIGTYSYRGLQLADVIRITSDAKVDGVELESMFVEPSMPGKREELRQWRLGPGVDEATAVRKKLDRAGIHVYAYNLTTNDTFTDDELERVLLMTKALGAPILNTSANLATAKRLAPIAQQHKLRIGLHPNGNAADPNSIGSGDSFRKAFEISPLIGANPDLSLCKNWGPDPIAFIKEIHSRITTLHFHDRKGQTWVPFGEGDMPTREVLLLAKQEKYDFTFSLERIYTVPGFDQLTEIRNCVDFCRKVLG